jgi:hypothetical protein
MFLNRFDILLLKIILKNLNFFYFQVKKHLNGKHYQKFQILS